MIRIKRITMLEMDGRSAAADHHTAGKKFLKICRSLKKLLPPLPIDIVTFPHEFSLNTA
jgi:hypothetical protein